MARGEAAAARWPTNNIEGSAQSCPQHDAGSLRKKVVRGT
jgi:hypothetical protein